MLTVSSNSKRHHSPSCSTRSRVAVAACASAALSRCVCCVWWLAIDSFDAQSEASLMLARVFLQEVRNGREDANPNQASASRCLQDDERRIQENMIEMLTVKLAKRERENELLKIQQVEH